MAAKPGKAQRTRQEQFEADEDAGQDRSALELPPTGFGGHLIDHLFSVGPVAGGEVLTFQELAAWSAMTGVQLDAWEAETLRSLSGAYLNEYEAARDAKRAPPWTPVQPEAIDRKAIASARLEMFKRLAAQDAARGQGPRADSAEGRQAPRRSTPVSDAPAPEPRSSTRSRSRQP